MENKTEYSNFLNIWHQLQDHSVYQSNLKNYIIEDWRVFKKFFIFELLFIKITFNYKKRYMYILNKRVF